MALTSVDEAQLPTRREYLTQTEDGAPGGRTVISSGPDGREIARWGFDAAGRELFHEEITHAENTAGREVHSVTYTANGAIFQKKIARFDRQGELVEMIYFDGNSSIIDHQIYSYSDSTMSYSRFDASGALVESWQRAVDGKTSTGLSA